MQKRVDAGSTRIVGAAVPQDFSALDRKIVGPQFGENSYVRGRLHKVQSA
jgi:hypothetical protein